MNQQSEPYAMSCRARESEFTSDAEVHGPSVFPLGISVATLVDSCFHAERWQRWFSKRQAA